MYSLDIKYRACFKKMIEIKGRRLPLNWKLAHPENDQDKRGHCMVMDPEKDITEDEFIKALVVEVVLK